MSNFTLDINLDNDAYYPTFEQELSRQLRLVADKIEQGADYVRIFDVNGNNVGEAEVILDD